MKLQQQKNGQFIVTLPKSIVTALGWKKQDKLRFMLDNRARIVIASEKKYILRQLNGIRPSKVKKYFKELKDDKFNLKNS